MNAYRIPAQPAAASRHWLRQNGFGASQKWSVATLDAGTAPADHEFGPFTSREVASFFARLLNETEAAGTEAVVELFRRALASKRAPSLAALEERYAARAA